MNFWNNFKNKRNLIAAHRGCRALRAESTMSAFEASLNNADFIELDVGFTKDGVAIVIHDDTLHRTSNVQKFEEFKKPYNVINYTYKQIKKLDFSTWFITQDPFNTIKNNKSLQNDLELLGIQRISTLKEILIFLKKHNFPVNIEIKDMSGTPFDKNACQIVVNIIKKLQIEKLVLLSSFNHSYIKKLSILAPNITRAALQENFHPENIIEYLNDLKVKTYNFDIDILDETIIKKLIKNNFIVNVFTSNDKKETTKLFNMGIKAVFTDYS